MVAMRFRAGMVIGGAVGYVLGARAGRERYEQIKRSAARMRTHPAVAQVFEQGTGVSDLVRKAVAGGLDMGSRRLSDVADRASNSGDETEPPATHWS